MLQKVREQRPSYNNNNAVAGSVTISSLKLFYYQLFAILYGYIGELAHSAVVNSSWTRDHIAQLWGWAQSKDEAIPDENLLTNGSTNTILYSGSYSGNRRLSLVYPPCNTTHLHKIALPRTVFKNKTMYILSIGQFRPEKDHLLQLRYLMSSYCLSFENLIKLNLILRTLKAVKDRSSKY